MYKNILTNLFNFCHLVNDEKISDNFLNAKTADEIHFFWITELTTMFAFVGFKFKLRVQNKDKLWYTLITCVYRILKIRQTFQNDDHVKVIFK